MRYIARSDRSTSSSDLDTGQDMKILLIALLVAYASADVSHLETNAKILSQELNVSPDGSYQWEFENDNGISAQAQGQLKNIDKDNSAVVVEGGARWNSPDGEKVEFSYIADEDGYRPQGSHIPTSPPIPEAIVRSLQYIRDHPPPPERP